MVPQSILNIKTWFPRVTEQFIKHGYPGAPDVVYQYLIIITWFPRVTKLLNSLVPQGILNNKSWFPRVTEQLVKHGFPGAPGVVYLIIIAWFPTVY